jgi:hypothetical protein
MIPVDYLKIVQAEKLAPGAIAILPEYGNALAIATFNDRSPLVFLTGEKDVFRLQDRFDIYGPALVLPEIIFEVEPGTASRNSDALGSLSMCDDKLALNVSLFGGRTYGFVKGGSGGGGGHRLFFDNWRAVIRDGERKTVLFEQAGPRKPDAVLDVGPELIDLVSD